VARIDLQMGFGREVLMTRR